MTYFPIPVEQFGGLNLTDDPGEVGFSGAIDICDIDLSVPGRLYTRQLFQTLATTTLTDPSVLNWGTNFIVSTGAAVKLYSVAGGLVGTAVAPNQYFTGSVEPFGTPTTSYLYMADVAGANAIRRLTTAGVISAPAGMPIARYLSRTPVDNRLVAGYVGSNPHRVQFSNALDAETWGVDDFVDLDPGDGEQITCMAVFHDQLYVFKQTKYFVFYGTSTDADGGAVFNFRPFRNKLGATSAVAGEDGVYIYGLGSRTNSIYRINGGVVEEVGRPVQGVLAAGPAGFTLGGFSAGVFDMCFAGGGVHILGQGASNAFILRFDPKYNNWTTIQVANSTTSICATAIRPGATVLTVAGVGANAKIHYQFGGVSDSLHTPVPIYQSGFESLAPPRRYIDKYGFGPSRKRVRSWRVAGTGTVTMAVAADMGSTKGATSLTLGVSPAVAEARYSWAIRGAKISYKLSGVGPWTISDLVAMLADTREPGSDVSDG